VDLDQEMRLLSPKGDVRYRVQLPREGQTIFVGWEQSGSVLAAVQKLGGAFLWFPAKPEAVQQWEGMQFSSKLLKNSVLKRDAHFDSSFAAWSPKGKLVLGLADGNFAVWDLASNETFMSRKHFAGRHKAAISCGAWGPFGENLALASAGQLKLSQPLNNASWEHTAAKLALENEDITFQDLRFSPSGEMLAAFAGSSVFRHLCLYQVEPSGKNTSKLVPVGEVHPSTEIGAIQAMLWLENDILAVVSGSGFVRLVKYDREDGALKEEQYHPSSAGVSDAALLPETGHVAIVAHEQITFFDPLLTTNPTKIPMWEMDAGVRPNKVQATKEFLLISVTDGSLMRVPLPPLAKLDLSLLTLGTGEEEGTLSPGKAANEASKGALNPGCRTPALIGEIAPSSGASFSSHTGLHVAYSIQSRSLAIINGGSELVVFQRDSTSGALEQILKSQLPESRCVFLDWDPTTGTHLAFALRGNGVGLWQIGGDKDINMWSGMSYKNNLFSFSKDAKAFDPLFAAWSKAGQLALGLSDGNFAVWDSVSSAVSVSQKMGRHKSGITAGAWLSSLFAPALALASTSTIKVSQGFESAEWSATTLKLKLPRRPNVSRSPSIKNLRSRGGAPEGLQFFQLEFSPSGKYLAAIAAPSNDVEQAQAIVYELQDQREALVAVYEGEFDEEEGAPFRIQWVSDDSLLIFHRTSSGGSIKTVAPNKGRGVRHTWPASRQATPGPLASAAATEHGLIAAAFATADGSGVLMLLACPKLTVLREMRLRHSPLSVRLYGPTEDGGAVLAVAYMRGGAELWQL